MNRSQAMRTILANAFIIQHSSFITLSLRRCRLPASTLQCPSGPPAGGRAARAIAAGPIGVASRLVGGDSAGAGPNRRGPGHAAARSSRKFRRACATASFRRLLFDATWLAPGGSRRHGQQRPAVAGHLRPALPDARLAAGDYARLRGALSAGPAERRPAAAAARGLRPVPLAVAGHAASWASTWPLRPACYSDFNQESSEAFRLTAHAAAAWTWTETAKIVLGAAYLDRPDAEVIPIGGVVWTPTPDLKFDLVFPHPKISHRVYWGGQTRRRRAGLGLHGRRVRRRRLGHPPQPTAATTRSCLSDYRFILGMERKVIGGLSSRVRDGLRLRPPHPLQQRHARIPPHRHRHAPRRADLLTPFRSSKAFVQFPLAMPVARKRSRPSTTTAS